MPAYKLRARLRAGFVPYKRTNGIYLFTCVINQDEAWEMVPKIERAILHADYMLKLGL